MRSLLFVSAIALLAPVAWAQERDRDPRLFDRDEGRVADFVRGPDAWRYKRHNGRWWYWQPNETWSVWNGDDWEPFRGRRRYQAGYRGPLDRRYRDGRFRGWPGNYGYYGPGYYGRGYGPGGNYYGPGGNLGANIGSALGGRTGAGIGAAIGRAID
ncbi:MAG: hypothetical protein DWQ37_16360 [Planctomycetota bacterium]|nr:MAG: hypothetical protein DWQ37_16360 [Planctomycetota bacterium]